MHGGVESSALVRCREIVDVCSDSPSMDLADALTVCFRAADPPLTWGEVPAERET